MSDVENPQEEEVVGGDSPRTSGRFARLDSLFQKFRRRSDAAIEADDAEGDTEELGDHSAGTASRSWRPLAWFRRPALDDAEEADDAALDPSMCDEPVTPPRGWRIPTRVSLAGGVSLAALLGVGVAHQMRGDGNSPAEHLAAAEGSLKESPEKTVEPESDPTPISLEDESPPEVSEPAEVEKITEPPPIPERIPVEPPAPPSRAMTEDLPPLDSPGAEPEPESPTFVDPTTSEPPPLVTEATASASPEPSVVFDLPPIDEPPPMAFDAATSEVGQERQTEAVVESPTQTSTPLADQGFETAATERVIDALPAAEQPAEAEFRFPDSHELSRWKPIPRGGTRAKVSRASRTEPSLGDSPTPSSNVPPTWDRHVVQRGENFYTIARTYYGSGDAYRALWLANRQKVPLIDELYVGTELLIPPKSEIIGTASVAGRPLTDPAVRRRSAEASESEPAPDPLIIRSESTGPSRAEDRVHLVGPNETLRSIARTRLGDPSRADDLFRLNRERIDDPRKLRPDTLLVLPPR